MIVLPSFFCVRGQAGATANVQNGQVVVRQRGNVLLLNIQRAHFETQIDCFLAVARYVEAKVIDGSKIQSRFRISWSAGGSKSSGATE
jgi:hypothetical protein